MVGCAATDEKLSVAAWRATAAHSRCRAKRTTMPPTARSARYAALSAAQRSEQWLVPVGALPLRSLSFVAVAGRTVMIAVIVSSAASVCGCSQSGLDHASSANVREHAVTAGDAMTGVRGPLPARAAALSVTGRGWTTQSWRSPRPAQPGAVR